MLKRLKLKKIDFKKIALEKTLSKKISEKLAPKKANTKKTDRQYSGQAAEKLAKIYLLKQGFVFIEKNYHCRHGEIDLIFKDNETIVFVEVRFRRQVNFGSACESIDKKKQKKIIKAAEYYLHYHRLSESVTSRFDVIGITPSKNTSKKTVFKAHNDCTTVKGDHCKEYSIEWIENAFQAF